MKLSLDSFSIFVIILLLLIVFFICNRWFSFREEGFVDFNMNGEKIMYIPQYSKDTMRKLIHLYDNIYYDNLNGALVETNGTQIGENDTSGKSIVDIRIVSRGLQGEVASFNGFLPQISTF